MIRVERRTALVLLTVLVVGSSAESILAAEIRIAVASNFTATLRDLADRFERSSGHTVTLSSGSTGKHYAQIVNGAPFDAFFAADRARPEKLEGAGLAVPDTRFTYALGRLVLYSPLENFVDGEGLVLAGDGFRHLAIANPRHAPYGAAARAVLTARGLWEPLQSQLVRGENVAQAFQYVASGNAELGFVAGSQVVRPGRPIRGSWWEIPSELYPPIEQQAVILVESEAARALWAWVDSTEAHEILRQHGYGAPR